MNLSHYQYFRIVPALWAMVLGVLFSAEICRSADERDVSAALTLRIAKFVGWPDRPMIEADRPFFIIGVMGGKGTHSAFGQLSGITVHGRAVKVVKITPSTDYHDLRRCHIVYAEQRSDVGLMREMVAQAKGVLTVAGPGCRGSGSTCLDIVNQAGKLAFDIDLRHTRKASLGLDAGLIQLAQNVSK